MFSALQEGTECHPALLDLDVSYCIGLTYMYKVLCSHFLQVTPKSAGLNPNANVFHSTKQSEGSTWEEQDVLASPVVTQDGKMSLCIQLSR